MARLGGSGGCVAAAAGGEIAIPFDPPAMPRGLLRSGEPARTALAQGESG